MAKISTLALLLGLSISAFGQNPNWAENIAPIMYRACTSCHHNGGAAPFSLMTFNDVAGNVFGVQGAVNSKRMPPWPPDPTYKRLAHERLLSNAEINTINAWVANSFPQGNPALAPTAPSYNGGLQIGTPDLTLTMPQYTSTASTSDLYRCFVMPTNLATASNIQSFECTPGNPAIVHHVLIYSDTSSTAIQLDNADPGPGYTSFGGPGSNTAKLIGGWVPGSMPMSLPTGFGINLPANAKIIIQVHYPAGSDGQGDMTSVNFKFAPGFVRPVIVAPALNHVQSITNGPLFIPANTTRTFNARFTVPQDLTMFHAGPHMHLIGRKIKSWAVTPTNDTIPIIRINDWNFHWQGSYAFRNPLKIPRNSILECEAFYDNTSANPYNPSNPPLDVSLGEATSDEMMLVYNTFTLYSPGDEFIEVDNSPLVDLTTGVDTPSDDIVSTPQLYDLYPNPAQDRIHSDFFLPYASEVSVEVVEAATGRVLLSNSIGKLPSGFQSIKTDIGALPSGAYLLTLRSGDFIKSKPFLK